MNKSIFLIIQEMTAILSVEQLQALQKSLIKNLVDEKPQTIQVLSNDEYISRYITATLKLIQHLFMHRYHRGM